MALTPTILIKGVTSSDSTSFTSTASVAPATNRLLTAFVASQSTNGVVQPTMSGNGLTWDVVGHAASSYTQMTVFRAMGTPTPGSLTFSFTSVGNQQTFAYSLVEWLNASTSGSNGAGAIAQVSTGSVSGSSVLTLTLSSAFSASSNAAVAAFSIKGSSANEIDPGWTSLQSTGIPSPTASVRVAWFSGQDLSIDSSCGSGTNWQSGVMFEVAEQTAGGGGGGGGIVRFHGAGLLGAGAL